MKDEQIFIVEVENINRKPDLIKISDRVLKENQIMVEVDANDKTSSGDVDIDQESLTFSCYFDKLVNNKLDGKEKCSNLRGVSFSSKNGKMNWNRISFKRGKYEFTIVAHDGGKVLNSKGLMEDSTDSETFSVSVKNSNRPPVLAKIEDQIINENEALFDINANDNSNLVLDLKKVRPENPKRVEMKILTFKS